MVAVLSAVPGVAPSAKGDVIQFIVDMMPVDHMLNVLADSISGPSLGEFLATEATDFFHDDIESRFYEEGDVKSGFWQPLTDTTQRIRESLGIGGSEPINRRTDQMFNFLMRSYPVEVGIAFASMSVPGHSDSTILERKIRTAQQGSNNNPMGFGPTPARPVLAVSELDAATLAELLSVAIIARLMMGNVL